MALMVYKAEMSTEASVLGATGETFLPFGADRIRRKFMAAAPQSRSFAWLGPSPRVTRRTGDGRFTTTAVWIGAWPPDTTRTTPAMRGVAQPVADSLKRELDTIADTWSVEFMPYDESVHGSLDQWRGGAASNTNTKDRFPSLGQDSDGIFPSVQPTPRTPSAPTPRTPSAPTPDVTPQPEATGIGTIVAVIAVPLAIAWGLSYASDAYASKSRSSRKSKRSR